MKLRCEWLLLAVGICATQWGSSSCEAQWRILNSPLQKPLRLMGHGWSAGYHWRNPGHDLSYYNPYSHHNSYLKSQWEYNAAPHHAPTADIFAPPGAGWNSALPVMEAEFRPASETDSKAPQLPEPRQPSTDAKPVMKAPLNRSSVPPARNDSRLKREGLDNNDWPFPID